MGGLIMTLPLAGPAAAQRVADARSVDIGATGLVGALAGGASRRVLLPLVPIAQIAAVLLLEK